MKQRPHRGQRRADADGVRIAQHERASLARNVLLIAAAIAVFAAVLLVMRTFDRAEPVARVDPTGRMSFEAPRAAIPKRADDAKQMHGHVAVKKDARATVRRRTPADTSGNRPRTEIGANPSEEERPDINARDYIAALRAGGETEGLAAFSPPGTRPPRSGVIVPDDYVLPEGFARHYQTTDDGRRLAPILALAPEYELIDYAGNPVPLTDDRIVPPDFAPQDLPVRMLEIGPEHGRERGDR